MNFIDRALAQGDALTDDGFLQAMADIYQEPQVWGELDRYPRFIRDVVYVIDYDTELQMEGLDACASGERRAEYIQALEHCGAAAEAELLGRAAVLTGRDADGEAFEALSRQLAIHQDYEGFWDLVRAHIGRGRRSHRQGREEPCRDTADTGSG